jgi:hypothetical protein
MKAFLRITGLALVLCIAAGASAWAQTGTVDAYSSASDTKTTLTGDALEAVAKALQAGSSDLANAATAKAAGYVAPKSFTGNVMSTNPDGSVGVSTMTQWQYAVKSGPDTLILQLTYGQNALNLNAVDRRGTLYIPGVTVDGKKLNYLVHFKVTKIDVMKYSDADFNAGKFNSYYSGKDGKKSQYTFTCQVLAIEEATNSVKLGIAF